MKIYINNNDVTQYILEEEGLELSLERERATQERVVNDVVMNFSNINGYFNTLFQGAYSTSKYWIKIYIDTETKLDFYGTVDLQSVIYSPTGASVTFNAFSTEREFWDRCKNKKINQIFTPHEMEMIYVAPYRIIHRQVWHGFEDLFTRIVIEPELAFKNIRFYSDNSLPIEVGTLGKYKDLDPKTSVFDFFIAFCINYNAEFYIDNNTQMLHFRRRKSITSTYTLPIDDKIIEDSEISVKLIDDDKYDYVETLFKFAKISDPLTYYNDFELADGLDTNFGYSYLMTYNLSTVIGIVEIGMSEIYHFTRWWNVSGNKYGGLQLTVPSILMPEIISINIYRSRGGLPTRKYFKIQTVSNPPPFWNKITDKLSDSKLANNPLIYTELPYGAGEFHTAWIGYDNEKNIWRDIILNNQRGLNQPSGNIFESIPKLNWISENTISNSVYMYYFFGMEADISFLMDTWRDLMTIKHKLETTINDMTLNVGDTVITSKLKLFPGIQPLFNFDRFRITKVVKDLIKEESEITGITI